MIFAFENWGRLSRGRFHEESLVAQSHWAFAQVRFCGAWKAYARHVGDSGSTVRIVGFSPIGPQRVARFG